ncbi:hypothetical protein DUI87_15740 [Hirundo rustica rustica]|uniref:Pre-mRNA-splicing factor 38B n=1 Tax=Hirundo rustica rustica TaxID=333673 RepID=A0A3M0JZC6_HIRRU|nr:hypothetical protein DUI87_15740 [Hirundo rustica rustica]
MVKDTLSIHDTDPQNLGEKIIHTHIYESKYWEEERFGQAGGGQGHGDGVHGSGGNIKPTAFLCLMLQPEDIIVESIRNEAFKYVWMLGALISARTGESELMCMDECIDELLRVHGIILPRLQKQYVLEGAEQLEPCVSALEEDIDDAQSSEKEEEEDERLE